MITSLPLLLHSTVSHFYSLLHNQVKVSFFTNLFNGSLAPETGNWAYATLTLYTPVVPTCSQWRSQGGGGMGACSPVVAGN